MSPWLWSCAAKKAKAVTNCCYKKYLNVVALATFCSATLLAAGPLDRRQAPYLVKELIYISTFFQSFLLASEKMLHDRKFSAVFK